METYYERYQDRDGLAVIISDIYKRLRSGRPKKSFFQRMKDFKAVRHMITFSLVNGKRNREILKDTPHIRVLDLTMLFHLETAETEPCHMKMMISSELMNAWGSCLEELLDLAIENTPRLHPPRLRTKDEMLRHVLGEDGEGGPGKDFLDEMEAAVTAGPLYILSNNSGPDGAAAMLYDGVLKEFADRMGKDLLIIPTTIHEVMVLPYDDGTDMAGLQNMLRRMNRGQTPPEDVLSDYIYYYERQENSLVVAEPGRKFFLGRMRTGEGMD